MTLSRHSVQITETETEFLLSIHASQKERAKRISSYRWDTERLSWVYPKTPRVYDALIEEFGNDLVGDWTITRPGKPTQTKTEELQAENQGLKEEIAKIYETIKLISPNTSEVRESETQALRSALAAREGELVEVRYRLQTLEKHLEEEHSTNEELSNEVKQLRDANQTLQLALEQSTQGTQTDFKQWIRDIAKDATGRDKKFCLIVDRLRLNKSFPIDLVKELEGELRRVLKCDDRGGYIIRSTNAS